MKVAAHVTQDDAGLGNRLGRKRDLQRSRERFVATVKEDRRAVLRGTPNHAQRYLRGWMGQVANRVQLDAAHAEFGERAIDQVHRLWVPGVDADVAH